MDSSTGKFYFQADDKKKVLFCFADGLFNEECGGRFYNEFCQNAKKYSGKDYSLIIDASGVKACNEATAKAEAACLAAYVSDEYKYKKYFMVKLSSPLAQHQVAKSAEAIPNFLKKMIWVNDKQEAYSLL